MNQEFKKRIDGLLAAKPDFALRLLFFSILLLGVFVLLKYGIQGYMQFQSYRIRTETLPAPFDRLKSQQQALSIGGNGTWLESSFELGQSYASYSKDSTPVPEGAHVDLYVIGTLSERQHAVVEAVREYLSVFFCRPVQVGSGFSEDAIPSQGRRSHPYEGHLQYNTVYIIDSLIPPARTKNSMMGVALTAVDLFPNDTWSFIFGQASPRYASAVASLARFDRAYADDKKFLRQALKTISHEAAHTLDIRHCLASVCLMNGAMDLEEAARKPLSLCPSCLAKLSHTTSCSPKKRLKLLHAFYRKYDLQYEAETVLTRLSMIPD